MDAAAGDRVCYFGMGEPFAIVDTTSWLAVDDEMMGTKPKYWLRVPSPEDVVEPKWLFKLKHRPNSGDDWSEKIASELAGLLGLPHATVELAIRGTQRGVISRDLVAECGAEELIPGNSLLVEADSNYPAGDFYHVANHTLDRIFAVLSSRFVGLPPSTIGHLAVLSAADLFTGYLLFDAWIANSDRHHENWAVLRAGGSRLVLSPSYDHAACLGHNVPDATRRDKIERTKGSGVAEYVRSPKVRSAIFLSETEARPLSPFGAFSSGGGTTPDGGRLLDRPPQVRHRAGRNRHRAARPGRANVNPRERICGPNIAREPGATFGSSWFRMTRMLHDIPTLFVTWRSPRTRLIHPVGRLTFDAGTHGYEFRYINSVRGAVKDGFEPFPEFPAVTDVYKATQLFPLFANRVMPVSRSGYATFLASIGLTAAAATPMVILARTGGRRATDQIEMFPCPQSDGQPGCYSTHCLLRSIRYMPQPATEDRIGRLTAGEQLYVMPDPQNPVDRNALAVRTADNCMIGYLPAYLTADLIHLQQKCDTLSVFVERVNPPPAEVHHRLLCRIVSCWPAGFLPFDTPAFQPIADSVESQNPQ